jgi:hypothetical protein
MIRTAAVVALFVASAAHAEPALFGIELGKAAGTLPKCTHRAVEPVLCKGDVIASRGFAGITFPAGAMPRYTAGDGWLDVDGDAIVRVTVKTAGIGAQADALDAMTAKWGKPAKVQRTPMQNSMGARFAVIYATWKLAGGYTAEVNGVIGGDPSEGSIVLSSPRALELDRLHAAARDAALVKP